MSGMTILVEMGALLLAITGFMVAFRSERVRGYWRMLSDRDGRPPIAAPMRDDEPVRYAMRIAGVMTMAFGTAIFLFVMIFHFASKGSG